MPRDPQRRAALAVAILAAAVAGVVILAARGGGTSAPQASAGGTARAGVSVAAAPNGPLTGQPAPAFSGTAVDGRHVDLASWRGRIVVLNFFATWCSNCAEEEPRLQAVARADAAQGVTVVGINYRETGDAVAFLRSLRVTYPALLDPDNRIGQAYAVDDLPVTVYVDRRGLVARVIHGQLTDSTLEGELAQLLGSSIPIGG